MEKGLFNSMFILIMLAMFIPSLSLMPKTQNIVDTKYQIEEITFTVDSIVSDALSDRTYTNTCALDTRANYDAVVNTYITNFENQRKSHSSVSCTYSNLNSALAGNRYSGSIDVFCSSSNSLTTVNIKKRYYFDKEINRTLAANCNVKIKDFLNAGFAQVDLNRS